MKNYKVTYTNGNTMIVKGRSLESVTQAELAAVEMFRRINPSIGLLKVEVA